MVADAIRREPLKGGLISMVFRLTYEDGSTIIFKESLSPPPGLFECEADGLAALRPFIRVPEVYEVGETFIVLEDMGSQGDPPTGYWEAFGRALGRMHLVRGDLFGYHRDNYIGTKLLDNTWSDDGREFFGRTRILRFLEDPLVDATLTSADRQGVERLVVRFSELIPPQGPCLTHGDLWCGNMLIGPYGEPVLIDPAVSYSMPEADLALLPDFEQVPESFYQAYQEVHPLEPGWRERLRLLSIRDALGMVAEFGSEYGSVERVRMIVSRFG